MTYIVVWVVFAVATGIVASNKGRNGGLWLLLGFLLGPVALVLSLVVEKNTPELEKEAVKSGGMKKCPYCAELVRSEAKVCRFCQRDLPSEPEQPSAAETADRLEKERLAYEQKPKGKCPNCKTLIALDSESCAKCKAAFGPGSAWKVEADR